MMAENDSYERELARLTDAFVAALPGRIEALKGDLNLWLCARHDETLFDAVSHDVHQLKGAGGTFGCNSISDAAETLGRRLAAAHKTAPERQNESLRRVAAAMVELQDAADRIRSWAQPDAGKRGGPN